MKPRHPTRAEHLWLSNEHGSLPRRTLCLAVLAAAGLGACAALPGQRYQMNDANAGTDAPMRRSGRLGVQVDQDAERSFSASFELQGNAETGGLILTTPIGTRLAEARWTPGEARLDTADGSRHFLDLDALAEAVFQQTIPLSALVDWLAGRPWSGATSTRLPAPAVGFEQLAWEVRLDRYSDGLVTAVRRAPPGITVRAKLDPA